MILTPINFSSSLNINDCLKDMEEKIEKNITNISSIFDSSTSIKRLTIIIIINLVRYFPLKIIIKKRRRIKW